MSFDASALAIDSESAPADSPIHVAIIGTAGRYDDASRMNGELYERMVSFVTAVQSDVWRLANKRVVLVSGGAPWADHVALTLFLRSHQPSKQTASQVESAEGTLCSQSYAGLKLFLPCAMEFTHVDKIGADSIPRQHHARAITVGNSSAVSTSSPESAANLMNQMHAEFSAAIGWKTMDDFAEARLRGAMINCDGRSFQARNSSIAAAADHMICFTWGADPSHPKEGSGSRQTWDLCRATVKIHAPLDRLSQTIP